MRKLILLALIAVLQVASTVSAEERGTLRGRFVYDGKVPEVKFDAKGHASDRLLVDPKDKGIGNVLVSLYLQKGEKPPVHPDLEDLRGKKKSLTMVGFGFAPHVMTVLTGQEMVCTNRDRFDNNIQATMNRNDSFNRLLKPDTSFSMTFGSAESLPMRCSSTIYPWMVGYLAIFDHPYFAVSDPHGKFEIPEIPEGDWTFRVWHEASGYVDEVSLDGAATKWEKGRVAIKMTKEGVILDNVKVAPGLFSEK